MRFFTLLVVVYSSIFNFNYSNCITIDDVLVALKSKLSHEQICLIIQGFLAEQKEKPLFDYEECRIFVPRITSLIAKSNFDPNLMKVVYQFARLFKKDEFGTNPLLEGLIKASKLLICGDVDEHKLVDQQKLEDVIRSCLIKKNLSSFIAFFNWFSKHFVDLNPLIIKNFEKLLIFLITTTLESYRHYFKPSDHDKIQPILFFYDLFEEFKGTEVWHTDFFVKIRDLLKLKTETLIEILIDSRDKDLLKKALRLLEEEGCSQSPGMCCFCALKIFFGRAIRTICQSMVHEACWFELAAKPEEPIQCFGL